MPARPPLSHDQRGVALLLAIILMLMLVAIGGAVSLASRSEILIAASFRQSREALYAAEGAIALAMHDLATVADWSAVLSGAVSSSFTDGASIGTRTLPGGDTLVLCCASPSLTDAVQRRAHEGRSWAGDTPQWQLFAWGPVSRWLPGGVDSVMYIAVWVADDPADGDGNPLADANGVLELHAHALAPGGGRRVVEALLERIPAAGGPALPGVRIRSWRDVRW